MSSFTLIVIAAAAGTLVASFLLGSIPWGVIISRLFYQTDLREHGSGNIGTTNALRTLGPTGGAVVFILDFLKGLVAGFLARAAIFIVYYANMSSVYHEGVGSPGIASGHLIGLMYGICFLACICGHIFSPWLKFKGGKGIAVAVGALALSFGLWGMLIELVIFALLVLVTRYVSVGSIIAAAACPFVAFWTFQGEPVFTVLSVVAAAVAIWAHRGNIKRLRAGTEPRIGAKEAPN
ncbi:MAG: glycerol-3-phosphate 1-O-acyltransferase PlsY [Actinomycetia bacterium]|nr:glycerol-3-phosphate 1-O-acyltransferase PlsY [Actinomycetes bacterium]